MGNRFFGKSAARLLSIGAMSAVFSCSAEGDRAKDAERHGSFISLDVPVLAAEEDTNEAVIASFDLGENGRVDFVDESLATGSGGLAIATVGGKGLEILNFARETDASPLEVYLYLAPDGSVPPAAIVQAHEQMAAEGRAEATPRELLAFRDNTPSVVSDMCHPPAGYVSFDDWWDDFSSGHGTWFNETETAYYTTSTDFAIVTELSDVKALAACQELAAEQADYTVQIRSTPFVAWGTIATYSNRTSEDGAGYQSYTGGNFARIVIHSDTGAAVYNLGASWNDYDI